MDWLESMNKVLNYIEENLTGKIDYKTIAKLANYSEYHFSRMVSNF